MSPATAAVPKGVKVTTSSSIHFERTHRSRRLLSKRMAQRTYDPYGGTNCQVCYVVGVREPLFTTNSNQKFKKYFRY